MAASDEAYGRLMAGKVKVERESQALVQMVEALVSLYSSDLTQYVEQIKQRLGRGEISITELEEMVMKLPVHLYFSVQGLDVLGVQGDQAKMMHMSVYNEAYQRSVGTIQDKTKAAELETMEEEYLEIAFARAYKRLRLQIDMAEHVFTGIRRALAVRVADIEQERNDRKYAGRTYDGLD